MTIDISRAWARTPSATALEAGGFLTLTNKAGETDRLVAAASPVAIAMKPRGYHLFFEDLKAPLAKGDKVPVTLTFEKAGTRQVELVVESEGPIGNQTLMEGYSG